MKRLITLFAALIVTSPAAAAPRRVIVQPIVVNLSGDVDLEEMRRLYTQAGALLARTVSVQFEEPIEVFAYCPIDEDKNILQRWQAALCPAFGAPGRLLMVVDPRSYTLGMASGTCALGRKCPAIHVNINPAKPLKSIIVIAHEIAHEAGAKHEDDCSLMDARAIDCGRRGAKLSARSAAKIRACFRRYRTNDFTFE